MNTPPRDERDRTPLVIGAVVLVVVVIAAIVAIATRGSGGDDDDAGSAATTGTAAGTGLPGAVDEYPPVEVTGEPLAPLPESGDDPAVGATPPTLSGSTYGGEPITIDPADGPMLVVFLAHWCPHCNAEVPRILEWRDSGEIPDELTIYGVSTGASVDAPNWPPSQWLTDIGWDFPTLADDADATALAAWGGTGFPYFVLVDAAGKVTVRASGEIPIDELAALVDQTLAA